MDFKILVLNLKNEIAEYINDHYFETSFDINKLLQGKNIDQLLEIEQNTNSDSLEPFPKNFDFIKIDPYHRVKFYRHAPDLNNSLLCAITSLIPNDYIYERISTYIFHYRNKNILGTYEAMSTMYNNIHFVMFNGKTITTGTETEVCDFLVSRSPCFVCMSHYILSGLQTSCNVIPIKQVDCFYYLKPKGLLTKAAIKK